MTLKQIARDAQDIVSASPDDTVAEVARLMDEKDVGSIVIERNREPLGIVTDRDLAIKVVGEGMDGENTPVEDVMTRDPITVHAEAGVYELSQTMREHSVRRMPVVNDDGELAGIVSLDDVFVLIADEMEGLSEVIREESPPY